MLICKRRFVDGLDWQEAGAYEMISRAFEQNQVPDGCRSWDDVRRRYRKLDQIFSRLKAGSKFHTRKKLGVKKAYREYGGVYVHIGRSGNILFAGGGFHRLAMALYAGLETIPAQVGVIHLQALQNSTYYKLLDKNQSKGQDNFTGISMT